MDVATWPAVWLRDNCPCPDCRVPGSGQKLFQITDLPEDLVVTAVEEDASTVTVTFGPDRHRSRFDRAWLAQGADAGLAGGGPTPGEQNRGAPRGGPGWGRGRAPPGPPGTGTVTGPIRATGPSAWRPCCPAGSCCCAGCRPSRAWWRRWRKRSGTCGRPTTGGCLRSGSRAHPP